MKRSRRIRLLWIGGMSAGAMTTSCGPSGSQTPMLGVGNVYTNDQQVPGAGYYHAPFRAWFAHPYNYFDPQTQRYFFGGQWAATPHQSITNLSEPTPEAARLAQAQRTDVRRGGFGSTARRHHVFS